MIALKPVRTTDPPTRILSLADAKAHLRVKSTREDSYIEQLVLDAEDHLDGYSGVIGKALITQIWEQKFDAFPAGDRFRLPLGPLQQVDSIAYYDEAGDSQAFTAFRGVSDAIGPIVVLNDGSSWPTVADRPDAVTVTWTCGYGDAATDVPPSAIRAARLLIEDWFDNRGPGGAAVSAMIEKRVNALISRLTAVGV